jgi:hypothetical protein
MYNRAEKKKQALMQANELIVPLLGISRRVLRLAGDSIGKTYHIHVEVTNDKRVHIIVIDLPASHPLIVAVYSSAQNSRPTSPQQLLKRIKRLSKEVLKLKGKIYEQADIVYIYLSSGGLTRGSIRIAKTYRIIAARKPEEARKRMAKYLAQRYRKLLTTLATRRVWGELPLLAYTLSIMSHSLRGFNTPTTIDLTPLVRGEYTGKELLEILENISLHENIV